ncbi:MAG: oligosaccharide flippase family protein [Phycisphaerae bacterium]
MSSGRVHARNLSLNTFSFALNLLVVFLLSPYIVRTLGTASYGVWSLLNAVAGYMGVLDLGIRSSVGRHINFYRGKNDDRGVDETIRSGLTYFVLAGAGIILLGVILGRGFPQVFDSIPEAHRDTIHWLLPLLAANLLITACGSIFSSVLASHDRFDLTRAVDLVVLIARTAGVILMLSYGLGLVGLAVATVGGNAIAAVGNYILAKRVHKGLRIWPLHFSRQRARELFGFGLAAFVSAISVRIIGQTDLLVMEWAENVEAVAIYSIGAMGIYYSNTLLGQVTRTFGPQVQRSVAAGDMETARWYFWRQSRLALILGIPMYVGALFFAEPFIRVWMGDEIGQTSVNRAAMVMTILAGSKMLVMLNISVAPLLTAMGHVWDTTRVTVLEAITNLGLSLLLAIVFGWGMAGVACGTLFARLLTAYPLFRLLASSRAGLKLSRLLARTEGLLLLAGGAFAAVCLAVRQIGPVDSWADLGLQVLAALAGFVPITWFGLLDPPDRRKLLSVLHIGRKRETQS